MTIYFTNEYRMAPATNQILDLLLTRKLDELEIIAQTEVGDTTLNIETTGVVPVAGNYICLQEIIHYNQSKILSVTPIAGNQYTIGIDSPLDYNFSTAGGCSLTSAEMNVNGSINPVSFYLSPLLLLPSVIWYVAKIIIYIQGSGAMDDGLFGDQPSAEKGVVLRLNDGISKNIMNFKNQGDIVKKAGTREYSAKAPSGKTSVFGVKHLNGDENHGVMLPIIGKGTFEAIVQDNLLAVDAFYVSISGRYGR